MLSEGTARNLFLLAVGGFTLRLAKPEHEPVLRALVARDVWVVGALTMALFVAVEMITIGVADDPEPRQGWEAALVVGGYLVAIAAYLFAARRSYDPEEGR